MKITPEKILKTVFFCGVAVTLAIPLIVGNGIFLFFKIIPFVGSDFFFPFIVTKALVFRIVVEFLFLVYLFLIYFNKNYRPKFNILSIVLFSFVVLAFISSVFGHNFHLSFWGDMERSEGLILWLHLLVYFIMLTSVFQKEEDWFNFFDISVFIGIGIIIYGFRQIYHLGEIFGAQNARVEALFGNAAFLAVYFLFDLAFALYLFLKRKNTFLQIYYAVLAILFLYFIIETQTRGAAVGLIAAVLICSFLVLASNFNNKKIRTATAGILIFLVLFAGAVYLNKNSAWVKNQPMLGKLAGISFNDFTTQTRLSTWQSAWRGWTENPKTFLIGYGLENFNQVFNRYFPTAVYRDEGSQIWFDRAHNLIFDRAVTTGLVGLCLYLIFILYPLYFLFKEFKNGDKNLAIIGSGLIVAFFIQDLFVFETITTYVILFFAWSFLATKMKQRPLPEKFAGGGLILTLIIIYFILIWPILNAVNIKPAISNTAIAKAMNADLPISNFLAVVDQYKLALESGTYGVPEYIINFIQFFDGQVANNGPIQPDLIPTLQYADNQIDVLLKIQPDEAMNYLLAMRHYNYTYAYSADTKIMIERLNKALDYLPKLEELSPARPHIYQEAGYSKLYLYRIYHQENDEILANQMADEAEDLFQKALDLNPKVYESYVNFIMLYLNIGQTEKINSVLDLMNQNGIDFLTVGQLDKLNQLAINNKSYYWVAYFSGELVKIESGNSEYWINLALADAYLGKNDEAIAIAEQLKKLGDANQKAQADAFIDAVKAGKYKIK